MHNPAMATSHATESLVKWWAINMMAKVQFQFLR